MIKFLAGIHWDQFEGIPEIFATNHHLAGYRYFAAYKHGLGNKPRIFQKLATHGQIETQSDWDWHHVVEGVHLEPLFSLADHKKNYDMYWPTVLMHSNEEHKILNSLFRSKGTKDGLEAKPGTLLSGTQRSAYLNTLYTRYQDIYRGDHLLQRVAHNVIRSIR